MSIDERIKAFTAVLKIVAWPAIIVWLAWYFRVEVKRVAIGLKFAPEQVPTQPTTGVSAAVPPGPASTPSTYPDFGLRAGTRRREPRRPYLCGIEAGPDFSRWTAHRLVSCRPGFTANRPPGKPIWTVWRR